MNVACLCQQAAFAASVCARRVRVRVRVRLRVRVRVRECVWLFERLYLPDFEGSRVSLSRIEQ